MYMTDFIQSLINTVEGKRNVNGEYEVDSVEDLNKYEKLQIKIIR